MPRIPIYETQVATPQTGPNWLSGVVQEAARGPAMVTDALGGLAKGVAYTADVLQDHADKDEIRKAATDLSSFQIDQAQRAADRQQNADPASPTYVDDAIGDYDRQARALIDKYAHNRKAQDYLDQRLSGYRTDVGTAAIGTHAAATIKALKTQYTTTTDNLYKQVAADPQRYLAAMQEADTFIDAMPGGAAQREALRSHTRAQITQSLWQGRIERNAPAALQQLTTGKFDGAEHLDDASRAELIDKAKKQVARVELQAARTRSAQQATQQKEKIAAATTGETTPGLPRPDFTVDFKSAAVRQEFDRLTQNSALRRQAERFDEVKTNIRNGIFGRADIDAQIARGEWPKTLAPELTQLADQVWARRQDDTAADLRFQNILKNRTPIDPSDRALGPALQRYVTTDFTPEVLPQLASTDLAAQATGFAKVAAFYTDMTPFQRAQVKFEAIPPVAPSDVAPSPLVDRSTSDATTTPVTPTTLPSTPPTPTPDSHALTPPTTEPSRPAFALNKILPTPVANAAARAFCALDPAGQAKQALALFQGIGAEAWPKFCAELRATGRVSDTATTLLHHATLPDAEHTLPDMATIVSQATQSPQGTAASNVDPAAVKAAKEQARKHIFWITDKVGLGDFAVSLAQTGAAVAAAGVARGDSTDTAINNAAILLFGDGPALKLGGTRQKSVGTVSDQSTRPRGTTHDEYWIGAQPPEKGDHTNAVDPKALGKRFEKDDPARAAKAVDLITQHYGRFMPADRAEKLALFTRDMLLRAQALKDKNAGPDEIKQLAGEFAGKLEDFLPSSSTKPGDASLNNRARQAFNLALTGRADTEATFYLHALPPELATQLTGVDPTKGAPEDRAITAEDRLMPYTPTGLPGGLVPYAPGTSGSVPFPDADSHYLREQDLTPGAKVDAYIGKLSGIRGVSKDKYQRDLDVVLQLVRPEYRDRFRRTVESVRNGTLTHYTAADDLRDEFVPVNYAKEAISLIADFVPVIGQIKLGFELAEHVDRLYQGLDNNDQRAIDTAALGLAAGLLAIGAPAAGRLIKRLGKDAAPLLARWIVDAAKAARSKSEQNWQTILSGLEKHAASSSKPLSNAADDVLRAAHLRGGSPDQYIAEYKLANPHILNQPGAPNWEKPWTRSLKEMDEATRTEIQMPKYLSMVEEVPGAANKKAIGEMKKRGIENPLPPYHESARTYDGKGQVGQIFIQTATGKRHYSNWMMPLSDFERIMKLPNSAEVLASTLALRQVPTHYRVLKIEREEAMRAGVVGPMPKWDQPGGGVQIELHSRPPKGHYSNVKELSKYTPWTVVQRSGNRETTR